MSETMWTKAINTLRAAEMEIHAELQGWASAAQTAIESRNKAAKDLEDIRKTIQLLESQNDD